MATIWKRGGWVAGALAVGFVTAAAAQAPMGTPIPPAAKDFASDAVQASQYEIVAAQVALAQSQTSSVRAFAEEMIADHTRAQEAMTTAAIASGLPAPPLAMNSDEAHLVAALQGVRGADFDKLYARQQVLAHSQALAVEQSYASAGGDGNLRQAAQGDVPMIQHHLEMAKTLADTLG
jgi:putative membrane protein